MDASASNKAPVAVLEGVCRAFGTFEALRGVNLRVQAGDVYGLLGLNGAGKTTSLRILLHLLRHQRGRVQILGRDIDRHWVEVAGRIGAMIEAPAFYPNLDGLTNLKLLHDLAGAPEGRGPERALQEVGLTAAAHTQTRKYSQGMLQRLYLAQALLGSPELLVLDEPTSNLDPRGILEVRRLIGRLSRQEGVTIILSSHQLSEIEELCNRVAILHRGEVLTESDVSELFDREESWIELEIDAPEKGLDHVRGLPWCSEPALFEGRLRVSVPRSRRGELNTILVREGFYVSELVERKPTLEDYFHRVTGDGAL